MLKNYKIHTYYKYIKYTFNILYITQNNYSIEKLCVKIDILNAQTMLNLQIFKII